MRARMNIEAFKRESLKSLQEFVTSIIDETVDQVCKEMVEHLKGQIVSMPEQTDMMISEVEVRCAAAKAELIQKYDLSSLIKEDGDGNKTGN